VLAVENIDVTRNSISQLGRVGAASCDWVKKKIPRCVDLRCLEGNLNQKILLYCSIYSHAGPTNKMFTCSHDQN
jgi:hypothetical protein